MNKAYGIGVVVFLLIGGIWFAQYGRLAERVKEAEAAVQAKGAALTLYRDMAGSEHAQRLLAQGDNAAMRDLYRHDMDSVAARLRIKPGQITGIGEAATEDSGHFVSVLVPVYIHDTFTAQEPEGLKVYRFTHQDRWLTFNGLLDTVLTCDYAVRDSITITTYWTRKWFGGRKTYLVDGYSVNPNCRVDGLTGIRCTEKQPSRFGVVVFAGADIACRPTVGVGIAYTIFSF